eukprot:TRINITY_DN6639_c0_g1_i2.p1 TRINITY_DN6639_c0_g1~~TRINITY_DN6639_c0_g1_i2.p1  ORF type:complete len:184 (-),score=35.89 TRINITY_DN6639_c0_g1_i2:163-714(-)
MISTADIIGSVLEVITKNMEQDEHLPKEHGYTSSCFDSAHIPEISIRNYFSRLRQYTGCSDSCYILSFIYLDRLLQSFPSLKLTAHNVHRLSLITTVLAIKYNDDHYYDNEVYARVGGIPLNEFNTLEARVLQMMDCTLYVSENLFCQYYHALLLQFQNEYGGEKRWAEETLEGEIMTSYESC